ncbi:AMP-binding protein [Streptomyces somaliensis]|uniref:AMP-binding protein n=1 Tax=Streptomyces somaliensis TaxID=78355 RepID=UPI0037047E0C
MLDSLAHALRRRPDRPAVLGTTRTGAVRTRATCGELADLANRYAAALHARGVAPGGTVGVAVRPGPRALAVMLAVHRLGARAAVLDPGAGPDVLCARLALARPDLVLADAAAQAVAGWAGPLARRVRLALPDLTGLGPVATVGPRLPGCAPALDGGVRAASPPPPVDGDGDAVIVFTSGTTSRPRAVVHSRSSLAAGMATVAELVRPEAGRPVLGGTLFVLVPSLACGAPVALPARSTSVLGRQLRRLEPQATYLTPPRLRRLLAEGARFRGRVWTGRPRERRTADPRQAGGGRGGVGRLRADGVVPRRGGRAGGQGRLHRRRGPGRGPAAGGGCQDGRLRGAAAVGARRARPVPGRGVGPVGRHR